MANPMKLFFLFCLIFLSCTYLNGQDIPFFGEDFANNTHQWKVSSRPYLYIDSNLYHLSNDEGDQPVVSIIDVPVEGHKNFSIETQLKRGLTPDREGGLYGVFFNAADERNGYAFVLNKISGYKFLKFTNGNMTEVSNGMDRMKDDKALNYNGDKVTIVLRTDIWAFVVNDTIVYSCTPQEVIGNKMGFYVSTQSGLEVKGFNFFDLKNIPGSCPIPFTQEQFNTALNKIICAAPGDFSNVQGQYAGKISDNLYWQVKDILLDGTSNKFITYGGPTQNLRKGNDFNLVFVCSDSANLTLGLIFLNHLVDAVNLVKSDCGTLKYTDTQESITDLLIKAVRWEADIKSGSQGNVSVLIELDLVKSENKYLSFIHVNVKA